MTHTISFTCDLIERDDKFYVRTQIDGSANHAEIGPIPSHSLATMIQSEVARSTRITIEDTIKRYAKTQPLGR